MNDRIRPTPDEFKVLAIMRELAVAGTEAPSREAFDAALAEAIAKESDLKIEDLPAAFAKLLERGLLVREGECRRLAPEGRIIADICSSAISPEDFGEWMTKSERSAAFATFCERVYGLPLLQFNMVDRGQLETLAGLLAREGRKRVLDLGCGIGTQAEYLAGKLGVHVTGLDYAPASIARAAERTAALRDRLEFMVGNMDELPTAALSPASFDAVLALDTLYFAKDLDQTLADIMGLLAPGGRLYAFWSDYPRGGKPDPAAGPGETRLGMALARRGLRYEVTDFSASERAVWERSLEAAVDLRPAFEAEGNLDLWWGRVIETEEVLETIRALKGQRYLYVVRDGG